MNTSQLTNPKAFVTQSDNALLHTCLALLDCKGGSAMEGWTLYTSSELWVSKPFAFWQGTRVTIRFVHTLL